jgi:hypothetical protein
MPVSVPMPMPMPVPVSVSITTLVPAPVHIPAPRVGRICGTRGIQRIVGGFPNRAEAPPFAEKERRCSQPNGRYQQRIFHQVLPLLVPQKSKDGITLWSDHTDYNDEGSGPFVKFPIRLARRVLSNGSVLPRTSGGSRHAHRQVFRAATAREPVYGNCENALNTSSGTFV